MAQLMYSVLTTGYMFRNALFRLELQTSLAALPPPGGPRSLPGGTSGEGGEGGGGEGWAGGEAEGPRGGVGDALEGLAGWAPGAQADAVEGHVTRWRDDSGAESMPARDYIRLLEREVLALRSQIRSAAQNAPPGNQVSGGLCWGRGEGAHGSRHASWHQAGTPDDGSPLAAARLPREES